MSKSTRISDGTSEAKLQHLFSLRVAVSLLSDSPPFAYSRDVQRLLDEISTYQLKEAIDNEAQAILQEVAEKGVA